MKAKIFAAAALITLGALGSANAADLPMPAPVYKAPPPPPVYNWTGCYIAGGGGYGMWTEDSFVRNAAGTPISGSLTNGGKGWFGMGQAGCDYEFTLPLFSGWSPRLVIGAFGDWDGGNIYGTSSTPLLVGRETEKDSWFAGGRVGMW